MFLVPLSLEGSLSSFGSVIIRDVVLSRNQSKQIDESNPVKFKVNGLVDRQSFPTNSSQFSGFHIRRKPFHNYIKFVELILNETTNFFNGIDYMALSGF